jgi:hypothetical protein
MTPEEQLLKLPVACDWVEYNGETVFMMVNYERTEKARKPMVDLAYCATEGINGNFEKTVQWDKNKFKPSVLGKSWEL